MALDADIAILGGGCAGLSLAARLADAGARGPRVVVVEPRAQHVDDRSWCFWSSASSPVARLASVACEAWSLSTAQGEEIVQRAPGLAYRYVRGADFYGDALARIVAPASRVTLLRGVRAGAVRPARGHLEVETTQGTLRCATVVDTRPSPGPAPALLRQQFAGVELRLLPSQMPADGVAGLMQQLDHDRHGLRFDYVLPLGPDRVLAEATRFSVGVLPCAVLARDLAALLARRGWGDGKALRHEQGCLPMGLADAATAVDPRVHRAGIGGGALRASSGFGYVRIQRWADACAHRVLAGAPPCGHPREPALRALLDRTFLRALRDDPGRGPAYFMLLAQALDGHGFVRFMGDDAHWRDTLRAVACLPPRPFLRALLPRRRDAAAPRPTMPA